MIKKLPIEASCNQLRYPKDSWAYRHVFLGSMHLPRDSKIISIHETEALADHALMVDMGNSASVFVPIAMIADFGSGTINFDPDAAVPMDIAKSYRYIGPVGGEKYIYRVFVDETNLVSTEDSIEDTLILGPIAQ